MWTAGQTESVLTEMLQQPRSQGLSSSRFGKMRDPGNEVDASGVEWTGRIIIRACCLLSEGFYVCNGTRVPYLMFKSVTF